MKNNKPVKKLNKDVATANTNEQLWEEINDSTAESINGGFFLDDDGPDPYTDDDGSGGELLGGAS